VRSVKFIAIASALIAALAVTVSACGGGDDTTTVTQTGAEPTTQTTSPTTTTPTTTTTGATTTTSTAAGPAACGSDQAFSQVSKTCVNTNSGGNPCPEGQVPMADRPVCVAKD
jgi:hypothetical protein